MKIEWAPLKVPPARRLQTMITALFTMAFFVLLFSSYLFVAGSLIYGGLILRSLILIYLVYMYLDHKRTHSIIDSNGWMLNRTNTLYRSYRNYFPVELVKTAELPANRNYILASFPHGILGTGIGINMGVEISKWLELFPQIRPKVGTLDQHFLVPFMREVLRAWGLVSVSKEALIHMLTKSNDPKHADNRDGFTSNAVAILVGGAQEAMDSHPGQYILTLKSRKGFVKMAIRTGSSIVPSFSFGEVDIFDQVANPPDSLLRRVQSVVKKLTGVAPLIPVGRGFFNYTFGFLPQRRRIVQVVGAPIDVVKSDQPDAAYVDKVHGQVMEALEKIFDQYKEQYIPHSKNTKLVIH
ncbi:GL10526 [Drosophila persimilis]|uniref:Acyltransferase n=2 Tax=pseudoobscura subgroup TaxID=32358 RepID=A0A6I8UTZ4_DROPS|nr:diacylglycerol O-acyltransferase 2 [Drosophila pseudoobscura]XP_002016363.1 diacylglycerol O-acyltransferase 2 [Drosophila persimilis]EDW32253.1 GL10526 [Drosophila persimilis]